MEAMEAIAWPDSLQDEVDDWLATRADLQVVILETSRVRRWQDVTRSLLGHTYARRSMPRVPPISCG